MSQAESESANTEVLKRAVALHREGRFDVARPLYEQVLAASPDSVDALHFYGLLTHQTGDSQRAVQLIARAISLDPAYVDAHSNLGNVLKELGQLDDARTSYENALACDPEHLDAHNNLGVLLRYLGDIRGSLEHLMTAIVLRPDWAYAHYNLGNTWATSGRADQAEKCFRRSIELDSKLSHGYQLLGWSLHALGRQHEAEALFKRLLVLDPGNPIGTHMLAACRGGDAVPERASDAFVTTTFDEFASSFESQLERLGYRGPQYIAEALAAHGAAPQNSLRILDLGCGTGLCGPLLRPFARVLEGVDLSSGMLDRARTAGHYDRLVERELVEHLRSGSDRFDAIVAADTLIYFGDLAPVFDAVRERLEPGGHWIFTLEHGPVDLGHHLFTHGRYGHGRRYVETRLREAGFELLGLETREIRRERGEPVKGWVVAALRSRARATP